METEDVKSLQTFDFEEEEDHEKVGPVAYFPQLLVASVSLSEGMLEGFVIAYSAVLVPLIQADPNAPFVVTENLKSLIASMMMLGQGFGAIASGFLTSYLGRLRFHAFLLVPSCSFWFLYAFPPSGEAVVAGRFFQGLLIGGRIAVGQLYAAEAAHRKIRGSQTTVTKTFLPFGTMVVAVLSKFLSWRTICIACAVIPLVTAPAYLYLPESPVWFLMKGRKLDAEKALLKLRGKNYDIYAEADETWQLLQQSREKKESFLQAFQLAYVSPIAFCVMAITLRMFTGAQPVMNFTKEILSSSSTSSSSASTQVIIVAMVQFLFGILSAWLFDWFGRRKTAIASAFSMGLGLAFLGTAFFCNERPETSSCHTIAAVTYLPLASLLTFIAGYSSGVSSVVFVLVAEMIPVRVKNVVSTALFGYNAIFTFVVLTLYYPMRNLLGFSGVFWFYSFVCFALCTLFFFFLQETKGQSAAEIERRLTQSQPSGHPAMDGKK